MHTIAREAYGYLSAIPYTEIIPRVYKEQPLFVAYLTEISQGVNKGLSPGGVSELQLTQLMCSVYLLCRADHTIPVIDQGIVDSITRKVANIIYYSELLSKFQAEQPYLRSFIQGAAIPFPVVQHDAIQRALIYCYLTVAEAVDAAAVKVSA